MKRFSDFLSSPSASGKLSDFTVSLKSETQNQTLYLKLNSKDVITDASYEGKNDPWIGSLCQLIIGLPLSEAHTFTLKNWQNAFSTDTSFWDFMQDEEDKVFNHATELLRATLDIYRGRDYLYQESSPLICRCFGVRERDVLEFISGKKDVTLSDLAQKTKASMGCRSCLPELKRYLALNSSKNKDHYYKEKSLADWLLDIDYMLSCFPESLEWKMSVESFKGKQVIISFDKKVSQKEEEEVSKRLQDFLGRGVDLDLSFFLRRAEQRSNAPG